jgi:oligopeptide transport system substrate-binding protein
MLKKLTILMLVVAMLGTFAGCKKAAQVEEMVLRYNLTSEPQYLDPRLAMGVEFPVLQNIFDGLVRYNLQGQIEPSVAESYTISDDHLTWTFKLKDTKWSNGEPVTAQDFEYSWKTALSPEMASGYAYQFYYIKNGEAFNSSIPKDGKYYYRKVDASGNPVTDASGNPVPDLTKPFDPESVGVKAIDDKTLQVTLEAPTPYFIALLTTPTYFPINKKLDQSNPNWAKSADNYVSNGPFKLTKWDHSHVIEVEKNPYYWDKDKVKLDKIVFDMIESNITEMTMFENGELDWGQSPPLAELDKLNSQGEIVFCSSSATRFLRFNTTRKPLNDPRVRKALTLAIDRNAIAKNVIKGGAQPAMGFVPFGFSDATPGSDFRKVGGDLFKAFDPDTAKKLLADAGYPGGKGFPNFELLYSTNETNKSIAEAIQRMWKDNLGIGLTLVNQETKVISDRRTRLEYDILLSYWGADYADPMTFIDMWITGSGSSYINWSNKQYDEYVKTAKSTEDQKVRMDAMHKAEAILMDEMPICPIYFPTSAQLVKPYVKDYYFVPPGGYLGIDFKWAYIEAH